MADKQKILDLINEQVALHKEQIEISEEYRQRITEKLQTSKETRSREDLNQVLLFKDKIMHHQTCISCLTDVIEVVKNA